MPAYRKALGQGWITVIERDVCRRLKRGELRYALVESRELVDCALLCLLVYFSRSMHMISSINILSEIPAVWLDRTVVGLRIGFVVCAGLFVGLLFQRFRRYHGAGGPNRFLAGLCVMVLAAVFVHQAIWQLAGFRNAKFVVFMSRYSPRVAGSASSMQRGRILDRNGLILAETIRGQRLYPHGVSVAHITGYSNAKYGKTGVERADDDHLRGAALPNDPRNLQQFARNLISHRLVTGYDTVLTIDARLQAEAYRLLGGERGAIVGISPRDGSILVLVSSPSFDPAAPEKYLDDDNRALFNRALTGLYPPGSTYKAMVAAIAAEYRMGGVLDCPAEGIAAEPGARPIRDHEYYAYARNNKRWQGYGAIDIREGFARSSNVYFAQLGLLLGADRMNEIVSRFGFDKSLAVFMGSSGAVQSERSRLPILAVSDRRETAQVALGQGTALVTPLHMAAATAAIANGGKLYMPYLHAARRQEAPLSAISERAAKLVTEYMIQAVQKGTGIGARVHGLPLAGKTGTAQTPSGAAHGWFIAFGPTTSPALALAVIVENSGYGSKRAVPIARDLFIAARAMGLLDPAATGGDAP